ncbi:MAG TPA: D-alanyl-D-alanine carboxypeptidase, partial [Hellea balneolensis]|nr:D-alanyl-D-alanine carboxypeptidase [Hellea balneolensis]
KQFTWNNITQPNRNPLLQAGYAGADGLKTGHTKVSKYGFVGSAIQGGDRRIFVVNGLESKAHRRSESLRIMDAAFQQFRIFNLFKSGDKIGSAKVYMGKSETVPLITKTDVKVGLHRVKRPDVTASIRYNDPLPAPIVSGDQVAELIVELDGKTLKTIPLYAGENVPRKSAFARLVAVVVAKIRGE